MGVRVMTKQVLSVPGGKDSTALYLYAIEQGIDFIPVFADTGNEHEITYEYVSRLADMTGGPDIRWVKADFSARISQRRRFVAKDQRAGRRNGLKLRYSNKKKRKILKNLTPSGNPFLDLCLWKGRFPSTRRRFCSEELKHNTIYDHIIEPLLDAGHTITSWQGVRSLESIQRSCLPISEPDPRVPEIKNFRPIIGWTADDVFSMHKRHGVIPNPLYKLGCARVGCMPCIHANKAEIANISIRFPEHIKKIERWEALVSTVSKRGISTMFSADKIPGEGDTRSNINAVVRWSKTNHGGKQFSLQFPLAQCASIYGLCE
jgi:3'-phosphoadenosine 5'-phosphosulfate sulfotransferase (PAPS reductase)/FAD synthetase